VQKVCQQGFTFIELSIVLVIIGLIAGGILFGRDLIHAATVRAQVSQFATYDTAVNTFRDKYGDLPGDLLNPASFGFTDPTSWGWPQPNGNGLIEDAYGVYPAPTATGEVYFFFIQLSQAGLIQDGLTPNASSGYAVGSQFPALKDGNGGLIATTSPSGKLEYYTGFTGGYYWLWGFSGPTITPSDAFAIDSKMDDGAPLTGIVQSACASPGNCTPAYVGTCPGASGYCAVAVPDTIDNQCMTSAANNTYNTTDTTIECMLLVQSAAR
jgi:prepilin-type N-terminal cleavage/methylation domain-containing protein